MIGTPTGLLADRVRRLVETRLSPLEQRLWSDKIDRLVTRLADLSGPPTGTPGDLVGPARSLVLRLAQEKENLTRARFDLVRRLEAAADPLSRKRVLYDFLLAIEPERNSRPRRERRELLDLVDAGLANERFSRGALEIDRMAELATELLAASLLDLALADPVGYLEELRETDSLRSLLGAATSEGRWQNRCRILRAIRDVLAQVEPEAVLPLLGARGLSLLARAAQDPGEECWTRLEAIRLFSRISPSEAEDLCRQILSGDRNEGPDANLFLKEGILRHLAGTPAGLELASRVLEDAGEKDFVRMAAARAAATTEAGGRILERATSSGSLPPKVMAVVVLEMSRWATRFPGGSHVASSTVLSVLDRGRPSIDTRVALEEALVVAKSAESNALAILAAIDRLIEKKETPVPLVRAAEASRERILLAALPHADRREGLVSRLRELPAGSRLVADARELALGPELLGRTLVLASAEGHGIQATLGPRKVVFDVGDSFAPRLWRILHELLHPAPDKRKGHPHWIGRRVRGTIRAPSGILAELSRTKVPGERVFNELEEGWRPFLPLVDDLVAGASRKLAGRTVSIFSFQGVTRVTGPVGFARLKAWTKLVLGYSRLEALRGDPKGDHRSAREFLDRARSLGFRIEFEPHAYEAHGVRHPLPDRDLAALFRRSG